MSHVEDWDLSKMKKTEADHRIDALCDQIRELHATVHELKIELREKNAHITRLQRENVLLSNASE